MVMGTPTKVTGLAHIGDTGVDEESAFVLGNDAGQLAVLASAVRTNTPHEARILGLNGSIYLPHFWAGSKLTLNVPGKDTQVLDLPFEGNGYNYEAIEVGQCLRQGLTESAVMPLDETLAIMKTMDKLRAQWGLKYPDEARK